ncbi:hypothetical protein H2248_011233 [Termitomyces sp. 'cryptogamus']|nr:hypothetical protein H2248_011233 [Termitomyces sp. 'cryptogamus']
MSNLKVCYIAHTQPFNPDTLGSHKCGQWKPDVYDDEEPEIRRISVAQESSGSGITVSVRQLQKARREFSGCMEWPPFQGGPPYILPKLHLLYLGTFDKWFFQFSLPALKSFSTIHIENAGPLFKINAKPTYFVYGNLQPISGCHSDPSASDNDSPDTHHIVVNCRKGTFRVKTKHYPKPPLTSSLFRRFPNTIKALFIPYDGLELDKVL